MIEGFVTLVFMAACLVCWLSGFSAGVRCHERKHHRPERID